MRSISLLKFLTESGFGSRRKMADAIKQGQVQVNGIIAEDFKYEIDTFSDIITVDGKEVINSQSKIIYLMLNKPAGIITTTNDEKGRQNVIDIIPDRFKYFRLYPVGRLDKDSTGLLLLTNDGNLTYQLTHPKFEHEKEYLVSVNGTLKPRERQKLEKGIELNDGKTSPARVRGVRNRHPFNYSITIREGKNRQVRRMFEELGYEVQALKRVRMGKLHLGKLKEGIARELSKDEISELFSSPANKQ